MSSRRLALTAGVALAAAACAGDGVTTPVAPTPQVSLSETLAGRTQGVAGVAEPAPPSSSGGGIRIYCVNSIPLSAQPMFVVDGEVVPDLEIHGLTPERIESIAVLKGPSAVAIYGSGARNGVVLIRTKVGLAADPAAR